ncbi:hypothetical protein GWI33_009020, partial [Rhynchophorus ferrugineus]
MVLEDAEHRGRPKE